MERRLFGNVNGKSGKYHGTEMKDSFRIMIAILGIAAAMPVYSETIYSTGFEPPTFSPGSINGQDNWTSAGSSGATPAAVISTENPNQGTQDLLIDGSQFGSSPGVSAVHASFFNANDLMPIVTVQTDARLDGAIDPNGKVTANLETTGANNGSTSILFLGEWVLSSDGQASAVAFDDTNHTASVVFTTPINLGQYYTLGIQLNFAVRTINFFFDGTAVGSAPLNPALTSNEYDGSILALLGSSAGDAAAYKAYYDNFSETASVPEPELPSLLLIGSGVAFLARRVLSRRLRA